MELTVEIIARVSISKHFPSKATHRSVRTLKSSKQAVLSFCGSVVSNSAVVSLKCHVTY
jgi:hypothetical protein